MPAPNHRTLPTPCERGCGRMCRCGLRTCHGHGGVVQVGARGRGMAWWERTAHRRSWIEGGREAQPERPHFYITVHAI